MLDLKHTHLDVYKSARLLVVDCHKLSARFPAEARYCLTLQLRRAMLSVKLNIAEGCSRKSVNERKRFFEISRGSLIEVDSAFESAVDLAYIETSELQEITIRMNSCFKLLSGLINAQ